MVKYNFNILTNSDSDSDSDIKSIKQSKKNINKYNFGSDTDSNSDLDSDSDSKLKKNNLDSKKNINIKIDNLEKNNISNKNYDKSIIDTTKKINKKQRDEQKKQKKEKYNILGTEYAQNKTTQPQRTLYTGDIEIIKGGKILLNLSSLSINSGDKICIVGPNGVGKTSLMKEIYDLIKDKVETLILDQDIEIESSSQTVSEFILCADLELYKSKKMMDELEEQDELDQTQLEYYTQLGEILSQKSWDKYKAESTKIITGLGFEPDTFVSILSGGKRMILALGKALLRCPEILMLDEPTNHLDLNTVIWLSNYLEQYTKTLIVITHQIKLVNTISTNLWYLGNPELTGNKIYSLRGSYNSLEKFLEQTNKVIEKNYEKFTKKITELKNKSTPKKDIEQFIKINGVPRPPKPYTVKIEFENVIELSTFNIIEFKSVDFNYQDKEIFKNLNISIPMGSRMILTGQNGIGKTTFFKLINGLIELKPSSGYIIRDERLRIGYYNQQILESLPLDLTPIQYLQKLNPSLDSNNCRSILGKLGIKKYELIDLPTNQIGKLSGGQKARVSFGSLLMAKPHLILLDEPTNHLDLESIEGLIEGINDFNGAIVIISHDMYLIESIKNTQIYQVKNSNIIKFNGDFDEYYDSIVNS